MPDAARIVVYGTESTGKTWLAERLARHFDAPWAAEFVRGYWDTHDGKITAADLAAIARGQAAAEDAAIARAGRVVFFDTDLLTCTLWNDLLFPGATPAWVRAAAETRARRSALYLLCAADVPFSPDPQRCFPDAAAREQAGRVWREALASRGLPFVEIRGDWPQREEAALAAVARVLGGESGR